MKKKTRYLCATLFICLLGLMLLPACNIEIKEYPMPTNFIRAAANYQMIEPNKYASLGINTNAEAGPSEEGVRKVGNLPVEDWLCIHTYDIVSRGTYSLYRRDDLPYDPIADWEIKTFSLSYRVFSREILDWAFETAKVTEKSTLLAFQEILKHKENGVPLESENYKSIKLSVKFSNTNALEWVGEIWKKDDVYYVQLATGKDENHQNIYRYFGVAQGLAAQLGLPKIFAEMK